MFQITLVDHVRLSFRSALAVRRDMRKQPRGSPGGTPYAKIALLSLSGLAAALSAIAVQSGGFGW
jgi:hypothetical protein